MEDQSRSERDAPTEQTRNPNISTENQPEGAARRPSDTLDREPIRNPVGGGAVSSDYNPETMMRRGRKTTPEPAGPNRAGMDVTKCLKPPDNGHVGNRASVQAVT